MTENKKTRKPRKRSTTNKKKSTTNNKKVEIVDVNSIYPENSCGMSKEEMLKQYENIRTDFDNIDVCNNTTIDCGGNCVCGDDSQESIEIVSTEIATKNDYTDAIIKQYQESIFELLKDVIPTSIRNDGNSDEPKNENKSTIDVPRRVMPSIACEDIVGVSPMVGPENKKIDETKDNYLQVVQDTSFLKNNKVEFVIDLVKKVIFYNKFFNKEGLKLYHQQQLNGCMVNKIREDNLEMLSNVFHGMVLGYGISCLIKTIKRF